MVNDPLRIERNVGVTQGQTATSYKGRHCVISADMSPSKNASPRLPSPPHHFIAKLGAKRRPLRNNVRRD